MKSTKLPPWEQIARASQMRRVGSLKDLHGLHDMLSNERARYRFLERVRWPKGFACPRCEVARQPDRPRSGMCVCVRCGYFVAVTSDSMFRDERIDLERWLSLFWMMASGSLPLTTTSVAKLLRVTAVHAADLMRQLGEVLALCEHKKLSGLVELDAGVLDIGDLHRIVVVAVECYGSGFGRLRMRHAESVDARTMRLFLEHAVAPTTTLRTDCWSSYIDLTELPYHHEPNAVPPPDAGGLEGPAVALRLLRRYSRLRPPESREALTRHIDAFCVRFNRGSRETIGELFCHLLGAAFDVAERQRRRRRRNISGVRPKAEGLRLFEEALEAEQERSAAG